MGQSVQVLLGIPVISRERINYYNCAGMTDCLPVRRCHISPSYGTQGRWCRITRIEVLGAVAIGVHFLKAFSPLLISNCELRIFDPDIIGLENLALQIEYSSVGVHEPKTAIIARELSQYEAIIRSDAFVFL